MRIAILFAAACARASGGAEPRDAAGSGELGTDAAEPQDALIGPVVDAAVDGAVDASVKVVDAAMPDAAMLPSKLDLQIKCRNDCVLVANPSSISVPAGTQFTVNWINTGDTECDVAKVDAFNQVPIVLGLEPGNSYHDSIRQWCGSFTGTFSFRVTICTIHSYIPVDCAL